MQIAQFFTLDGFIFIGLLLINLILGVWSSRNIGSMREYAVGNRNFPTATIVSTIIATWISGEHFFTLITETYKHGLYFIWPRLGEVCAFLMIGYIFAPRMGEFLGKLSIAEAMGDLYGKQVRIITAIAGCIGVAGIIAVQLTVAGLLCQYCFDIPGTYGIVVASVIVTIYASIGGINSVTFTDIIQLFTFGTILPTIALFLLKSLGSTEVLTTMISTNPVFDYNKVFDFAQPKSIYYLFFFLYELMPSLDPAFFQRISISKNTEQVERSFTLAAGACCILGILILWMGVVMLAANPNLDPQEVVKYLIFNYSTPGFKGLVLAGVMAMVMSTVDSYLNSTAILLVNDICKPLNLVRPEHELRLVRIASVVIGSVSLLLALRGDSLIELMVSTFMFYMPIVTVPFMFAIMGFRTSTRAVLIGMGAAFSLVITWGFILTEPFIGLISNVQIKAFLEHLMSYKIIDGIIPGMLMNATFLLGSHYILREEGGFVGIKDQASFDATKIRRKKAFKDFLNSIADPDRFFLSHGTKPKPDTIYIYFGLFYVILMYIAIFSVIDSIKAIYPAVLIDDLFYSVLIIATGLLSYPLWPVQWRYTKLPAVVWNTAVAYIVFMNLAFIWISHFSVQQVIILFIAMMIISIEKLRQSESDKTIALQSALSVKTEFLNNISHEIIKPVEDVNNMIEELFQNWDTMPDDERLARVKQVQKGSDKLFDLVDQILERKNV